MTIATEVARNDYVGTGLVATYPYTFRVYSSAELLVVRRVNGVETTLVLTTDYSVTGVNADGGGNIVLTANLASGAALAIIRAPDFLQGTDLRRGASFSPVVIETALDRLVTQTLALQEEMSRAIKLPASEAGTPASTTLPSTAFRANLNLGFNTSGNPVAVAGGSGGSATGFNVRDYGATGNGVTDDTVAILAAQTAAGPWGLVILPAGTYIISSPLVLTTSMVGDGIEYTTVKASASFVGDRMINLTGGREHLSIRAATVDCNDMVGVDLMRHQNTVGYKANRLHCQKVWFKGVYKNNYCIYSEETNNDPGGLVGSLFEQCIFESVGNNLYLGNNEDDITFLSCRLHMNKVPTAGFPFWISGVNTRFEGCYLYINTAPDYAGIKPAFFLGAYGYSFDNCFFEYGSATLTNVFIAVTPLVTASFKDCHLNLSSVVAPSVFKGFFRGNLSAATDSKRNEVSFENVVKYDVMDYPLLDLYVNGDASDYASIYDLHVQHCHGWAPSKFYVRTGKVGADEIYVRLSGHAGGSTLASQAKIYGLSWVIGGAPGVWLVPSDNTTDGANIVLSGSTLLVQRRSGGINGAVEATPVNIDIQAPNNSLTMDAAGTIGVLRLNSASDISALGLLLGGGAPAALWDEGGAAKGWACALDVGRFTMQRRAAAYGANEATILDFDITAPANSIVLDSAGYTKLLGAVLDTGSLYFRDGAGSDQAYFDYASNLLTINRASAAGTYEATLLNFNIQTGNLQAQSFNAVETITMEQAGAGDRMYLSLATDLLTWNRKSSIDVYEATLLTLNIQTGSLQVFGYAVAGLPTGAAGQWLYATNGRKNGEGAGLGTGVPVFHDGTAWRAVDTGATVAA